MNLCDSYFKTVTRELVTYYPDLSVDNIVIASGFVTPRDRDRAIEKQVQDVQLGISTDK